MICEESGPGDSYLQSVVTYLGVVMDTLGDLEEAIYYGRSALDNLRTHSDNSIADNRQRLLEAVVAVANMLVKQLKAGHKKASEAWSAVVSQSSHGDDGFTERRNIDMAVCREAEALYTEALSLLEVDGYKDREVIMPLLSSLNGLYRLRGCVDDAAIASLERSIQLSKEPPACSLALIVEELMVLSMLYAKKYITEDSTKQARNAYIRMMKKSHGDETGACEAPHKTELLMSARCVALEGVAVSLVDTDNTLREAAEDATHVLRNDSSDKSYEKDGVNDRDEGVAAGSYILPPFTAAPVSADSRCSTSTIVAKNNAATSAFLECLCVFADSYFKAVTLEALANSSKKKEGWMD
jgi:hypothetical protein